MTTDAPHPLPAPGFPVVCIGASAGGFEAVSALLRSLPQESLGLALVVIVHLSPERPSELAALLGRSTQRAVHQARDGMRVEPDQVYVIPPGVEMTMSHGALRLHPRRAGPRQFKPVDAFLFSLARERRSRALAVILSGADADGSEGLQAVKRAGGVTFAQDSSARVSGMPESSISTGSVDFVLPPEAIALELARLARGMDGEAHAELRESPPELGELLLDDQSFHEIIQLLRAGTGVDFSQYKPSTLRRRIARRMGLHHIRDAGEFVQLLRTSPAEVKSLHGDILIHVTQFFRDPEAFRVLQDRVLPELVERSSRAPGEPIRIWVPGCASGEEVYSIAICLMEILSETAANTPVQIFGTDISETAIERARAGIYSPEIEADLGAQRLQRFFSKEDSAYHVRKGLRDVCVFARHDVAQDPPFSRLDLISCRNVMIYMSAALQKRVLPLLHYGLNEGGYLFLGSAESVGSFADLFQPLDKRAGLFQKLETHSRAILPRPAAAHSAPLLAPVATVAPLPPSPELDLQREADRLLLQSYAPPAVIVNDQFEILHFRGRTGAYLEPPDGKATLHLISLAREGLRAAILQAARAALEGSGPAKAPAYLEEESRTIHIRAVLLGGDPRSARPCVLVIFEDDAPLRALPAPLLRPSEANSDALAAALARARQENDALRLHLQSVVESYEAAHEEIQSANEEILSSNEELQSTNEELGTAKEELQSSNEELSTVNDELQTRLSELGRINDDLHNVLASVQIPIVILTSDLRIRSFTPAAGPLFNLIGADAGRPLAHINIGIQAPELQELLAQVLESLTPRASEVQDSAGHWYVLRVRPYRTRENRIDGLVLALTDIDELKRASEAIAAARNYAEAIVETVNLPLLVLDGDLRVRTANRAFLEKFHVSAAESEGRRIYDLGARQWDIPELRRLLEEVVPNARVVEDFEVTHGFPHIGPRTIQIQARRVQSRPGVPESVLVALDDVTERRQHEHTALERDRLKLADVRKNEFLAILAHELRNPLAPIAHAAALLQHIQVSEPSGAMAAQIIARQAAHMARLLEDLLDVSRITHGRIELRKQYLDLRTALERAVESVRPQLESRRHRFQVRVPASPLHVDADPARLEQIIANLLGNAAKYTDPGGQISICAQPEDDSIAVRVRDDGCGIAPEMLPQIFDLFAQADHGLDRKRGCLGIGLTVVRRLVELHGGRIEAHSEGLGRGSEFAVFLPRIADAALCAALPAGARARGAAAQPRPAAERLRRVLVVEDHPDAAQMLHALLKSWGHEVRVVEDGAAALELTRDWHPQVAFVDIGLPGMSGYEVARALRALPAPHPRLIAMTGYGQEEDRERSHAAGFELHLTKPVTGAVLQELLGSEPAGSGEASA